MNGPNLGLSKNVGIRAEGFPCGTRWANMCSVWLIHPYTITHNHRGRAKERDNVKYVL